MDSTRREYLWVRAWNLLRYVSASACAWTSALCSSSVFSETCKQISLHFTFEMRRGKCQMPTQVLRPSQKFNQ
ncbi:hypothetical protein DPMN_083549 [Dreissena polymorpha]|uniref:Uncharacterized protein n=1 Tax=Dreissena polymorpha TaxID=45954 RepID=A0A9D3YC54_DREPO|nr:hypothetical protein DPMN_083549 [Dreissena polymorpha]